MSAIGGHILLLLDGEPPTDRLAAAVATNATMCIATDGAARTARSLALGLDLIIGDLDSIDADTRQHYDATTLVGIADQYSNDFEKALRYVFDHELGSDLVILGMYGRRTDHTLTNLSVVARLRDRFESVRILDEHQEHTVLTKRHPSVTLDHPRGAIISLTPLPTALGVTTHGLYYPVEGTAMQFGQQEGLSNILATDSGATVRIADGALLVSMPHRALS